MRLPWMILRISGFVGVMLTLLGMAGVKWMPIDRDAAYVGSAACESCHRSEHAPWHESLHQKMMRPVSDPGVVVADFRAKGSEVGFVREEALWAIGGKWEQQFMGHDGEGETLLPGVWRNETKDWDLRVFDGQDVPVPVRRCHGCHTVGLDPKRGTWVEENIGCESCHGPGGWHVETLGLGRIYNSVSAEMCGQCHVRGTSPSGEFFFPLGYRPGDALAEYVKEEEPVPHRTTRFWWGNGFERRRHQQYTAWKSGGHAQSLERLGDGYDGRFGEVTEECLECHAGDYILASGRRKPSVDEARFGITCAVCHQSHGDLDQPRVDCESCHRGGAFYHAPERNASHVACGRESSVGCVGCHMPKVVQTGGGFPLHSHRPGVVSPQEAEQLGMPSSCQNGICHSDRSIEWASGAFEVAYEDELARRR